LITLYLICIVGAAKKRDRLLKRVLTLNLQARSHYDEPLPLTYILFLIRRGQEVFQALYDSYPSQRWCDPVASYTKLLIDRILNPDGPLWDKEAEFFRGEFILAIAPLNIVVKETNRPMVGHPSSGVFLFISSAEPIIARFLRQEKNWIKRLFDRPLEDMLAEFDQTAHRLANTGGCWGGGFEGGALEAAFPEKVKIDAQG
jgi:hypothetical protein